MPAKDLGTKHTCWKCGTKFYDLKKPAPICPKCGANARDAPTVRAPSAAAEKRAAKAKEKAKVAEPAVEAADDLDLDEEIDEPAEAEDEDDDDA
jgi:uncharacterized protein (TIGR02300 family)